MKHGFAQSIASPSWFRHEKRDLCCVAHGDAFAFAGPDAELDWIQDRMHESFLVKVVGRLGDGPQDVREISILNRIVRWTQEGIHYEADPRHAELLVRDVEASGPVVRTPGVNDDRKSGGAQGDAEEASGEEETRWYRSGTARANYLAMDRPNLAFVTKEFCRRISAPVNQDFEALLRVARYYDYPWQQQGRLRVYVDTDFAECGRTRKSISGGCAMLDDHLVKHWSSTQKVVTLSSGEAELAGIVKAAAEALGLRSLASDLGLDWRIHLHADSSDAIGICQRSGIGKARHPAVGQVVGSRMRALQNPWCGQSRGCTHQACPKGHCGSPLRSDDGAPDIGPTCDGAEHRRFLSAEPVCFCLGCYVRHLWVLEDAGR